MKFILLLFTVFLSVTTHTQQLSGKVTYVVSMESYSKKKVDSIAKKWKKKKLKMDKWMRDIFENTPKVNAYLDFVNGESMYYVEEKMEVDGKSTFNMNRTFAGGDNKYYKNTKTKEHFTQNSSFGELLLIEIEPKKWKITQESKQIGKYLCFKAIDIESTNKKMKPIAWFTPQLPVSFGPLEYNGLPGLVILVEMHKRTISASEILLNPKEKIVVVKPTKGKKLTAKESREKGAAMWKNIEKQ
jgi:GLPGLI family protein